MRGGGPSIRINPIVQDYIDELLRALVDLQKQLKEVEQDRDHYKALCESLKDAPKPEYG